MGLRRRWRAFRARFWWSLLLDVLLLVGVLVAVHAWQTRNLPVDRPAPVTVLPALEGGAPLSAVRPGAAGVVYFFAPWCFYCRSSIDNLDALVDSGRIDWATAVALSYENEDEVRDFVERAGTRLPVLLGTPRTGADWSVSAFPTYYVIDGEGRIVSRAVGYSTELGLRLRSWWAAREDGGSAR